MMKIFTLIWSSVFAYLSSTACTTFCINHNGQIIFGRNYDWVSGTGIVYTNQRGLHKTSMPTTDGKPISWTSSFGSITFNQFGKEFPTGGMNEKGLVVELMWLNETQYPKPDDRPSVNVLQWIQYQLDNHSTVAEVIASDKKLRITNTGTPLHYLVADALGNVASIEFLNNKTVVHKETSLPFPVLTNNTYAESKDAAIAIDQKQKSLRSLENSLERYVKACNMIKDLPAKDKNISLTNYAFNILENVSQGDFTKWSIVYDITRKQIHFSTNDFRTIKTVDFTSLDFTCAKPYRMFDMNQATGGNISASLTTPDTKLQRALLEKALNENRSEVNIPDKRKEEILAYEKMIRCQ